jgi:hypothetical protein
MSRAVRIFLLSSLSFCGLLQATPSSIFWSNCTTDVYTQGECHIDEDNYFTVNKLHGNGSSFPPDTGFEAGLFSVGGVDFEGGVDYFGGTNNPVYFNLGAGIKENTLFSGAPAMKMGIFDAGTKYHGSNKTNQNIVDLIFGKTLPECIGGRFFVGAFSGSKAMGKDRQGVMVAYQKQFYQAKFRDGSDYYKWILSLDYVSGKNTIGGGGVAVGYYFTPDVSILTGPVWFNSKAINGSWKWSVQIDVKFSLL